MFTIRRKPKEVEEYPLIQHKGIFRRQLTLFEGVALIVSATIGAGVLGIPYAIAQVGTRVGILYIVILGALMIGLNLMIGEIAVRTKGDLQLAGLARKYLGKIGEWLMVVIMYVSLLGVLVVYIIGEGESLAALFGGSPFRWSIIFFVIGFGLIAYGIHGVKVVDFVLSIGLLAIIALVAGFSMPHIDMLHFNHENLAYLFFPYGVILFAFHGSTAVLEAHSILARREEHFKKAIIIAGIITILAYLVFTIVTIGVTGLNTTEIATIGLGQTIGPSMFIFGNAFAVVAMGTSFLIIGLSLKDSLRWDYKWKSMYATLFVTCIPLIIFLCGLRKFIEAIDIVGGVFVSLEMILTVLIYWRAKQLGDLKPTKYHLHNTLLLAVLLLLALGVGVVYSVFKLF